MCDHRRIVEFELRPSKIETTAVELWDVSGDKQYVVVVVELWLWLWLWLWRRQNGGGHRRARCDGAVAVLHCLTSPASGCHLSLHAAIVRVEAQKSKNALIMKCVLAQRQPLLHPISKVLKFSAYACGSPAPALQPQRTPRGAT